VRRAADVLAGLGTVVEEVDPGFADPVRAYHVLWFFGALPARDDADLDDLSKKERKAYARICGRALATPWPTRPAT
jgi:hypothetical protein